MHLPVAGRADGDAGRDRGAAGERDPAGFPDLTHLANLFMHYAFDVWMDRENPDCPFERYADDIIAHGDSEKRARMLRAATAKRLGALGLELHPVKTKIVCAPRAQRERLACR